MPKHETFTGPKDAWEVIWEAVKEVINDDQPDSLYNDHSKEQLQKAYDSIQEGKCD